MGRSHMAVGRGGPALCGRAGGELTQNPGPELTAEPRRLGLSGGEAGGWWREDLPLLLGRLGSGPGRAALPWPRFIPVGAEAAEH